MKRSAVLAVSLFMVSGSGWAAMYKCIDPDTGKPIFSQTPCAPDAEVLKLKVDRPTAEQVEAHKAQVESERQFIEESRTRRQAVQGPSGTPKAAEAQVIAPPPSQPGKPADL